jgi:hypothetical protein
MRLPSSLSTSSSSFPIKAKTDTLIYGGLVTFYGAAIAAGAKDNISPRSRVEYYAGYYAADVLDPDGYSFEVVHKS